MQSNICYGFAKVKSKERSVLRRPLSLPGMNAGVSHGETNDETDLVDGDRDCGDGRLCARDFSDNSWYHVLGCRVWACRLDQDHRGEWEMIR